MHVTTKDVVQNADQAQALGLPVGAHLLTSVLEADGACELASDKAKLSGKVLSIERTASGGISVQVAVSVVEPAVEAPKVEPEKPRLSNQELAVAYFQGKGFSAKEAEEKVEQFGVDRVLAKRDAELNDQLDQELAEKK